ncbi:DUF4168 domain-containing protein [Calothrix sp. 336/3]|uniref:DUF4168 domain-containing protein n=1 Tax=Calothrix sp. 336/3 TaxID=1337936 RepID=UPI0004E3F817|nr:DUF4168 domain-containing protein [Calothrix sp. 336/3]AKG22940.1 hypothetical protein IJ00_18135 [Calothrix sp. 336/3]
MRNYLYLHRLISRVSQSSYFAAISVASLTASCLFFISPAVAQNSPSFTANDINAYARATLTMEPKRQEAMGKIKKIIGRGELPNISCDDANSLNSLPREAKKVAIEFCNNYQQIVKDNGLSSEKFNQITREVQNNENLRRQIYNAQLRMQRN